MKKIFYFLCILWCLFLFGCTEAQFGATITLDNTEPYVCPKNYPFERNKYSFTFTYTGDNLEPISHFEIDIWRDESFAPNNTHPIYWTHFVKNPLFEDITLTKGYVITFEVCAPTTLEEITFYYPSSMPTSKYKTTIQLKDV